jgi:hypothetical protein
LPTGSARTTGPTDGGAQPEAGGRPDEVRVPRLRGRARRRPTAARPR